jgi:hypothetical protein
LAAVARKVSLQLSDREAIAMLEASSSLLQNLSSRQQNASCTSGTANDRGSSNKKGKTRKIVTSMYEHHGVSGSLTNPPEAAPHRLIKLNTRNYDGRR